MVAQLVGEHGSHDDDDDDDDDDDALYELIDVLLSN